MKYWIGSVVIMIVLFIGVVIDVTTTPATTDEHIALASLYLQEHNLPTPNQSFTHDGCTLYPDNFLWHNFSTACLYHDIAYWAGGERTLRTAANLEFKENISHTGTLGPALGLMMFIGVEYFGDSIITKSVNAHWGYGWSE